MADSRTKSKTAPRVVAPGATDALGTWGITVAAGVVATLAATATSLELVAPEVGLATAALALLVLLADSTLRGAVDGDGASPVAVAGIGLGWILACYLPFHLLFFPGTPLHDPIVVHGTAATLPVTLPTAGHGAVDLLLEGELPAAPGGGTGIPVAYTLTVEDAAQAKQVFTGRLEDSLRTQRLGRRGTATVVQAHHAERRLAQNPAGGDLIVTAVQLEPSDGASLTITPLVHRLPSVPIVSLLALVLLAGAAYVDARFVVESTGSFVLATAGALGAAAALWTSDTVHPTVSSLIGSAILGGPIGLGVGAVVWAIARRTLVHDRH
jgi:hypothetical protein